MTPLASYLVISLLLAAVTLHSALADKTEACQNFAMCLEKLEEKQRECRDADAVRKHDYTGTQTPNKCSKRHQQDMHTQVTGLHLRKTESMRSCLVGNQENASVVGSLEARNKCKSTYAKFVKYVNQKSKRKSRKGGKKQRKMTAKREQLRCRKERKALYKRCYKIATCCSLFKTCQAEATNVTKELSSLKSSLKKARDQCRRAAAKGTKA